MDVKNNRSKGIFLGPKIIKSQFPTVDLQVTQKNPPAKEAPGIAVGRQTPKIEQLPNGMYVEAPGGNARDTEDHTAFRHNRERDVGFKIGNYVQTPPLLFTRDGHSIYLGDIYRGSSVFIIAGGPSFATINKEKLNSAGVLTFGLNNAVKSFRTNLWTCVDDPTHFIKSIWLDPKIMKFAPFAHADKKIFDNENWKEMDMTVGDCPNVLYFRRNEVFVAEQYLFEDTINWGNHSKLGGGRSVLLAALRIAFYLGIRKVFLLGVDFNMKESGAYHFEQSRTEQSLSNNNTTYPLLVERFTQLRPIFEKYDFHIFNCNPESQLKVFDFVDFDKAVEIATENMPTDLAKERTEGLYDRKANEKREMKKHKRNLPISPQKRTEEEKTKIKQELDIARKNLNDAKEKLEQATKNGVTGEEHGELEKNVINKRQIFRIIEKNKNMIWFGSPERPQRE